MQELFFQRHSADVLFYFRDIAQMESSPTYLFNLHIEGQILVEYDLTVLLLTPPNANIWSDRIFLCDCSLTMPG